MSVLGFEIEWFDDCSSILHTLHLKYFLPDGTIEILQDPKTFLKRIHFPEVQLNDLFIGNSLTIYGRVMVIKSYANSATEKYFSDREIHCLCAIAPGDCVSGALGAVLSIGCNLAMVLGHIRTSAVRVRADNFPGGSAPAKTVFVEFITLQGQELVNKFRSDVGKALPGSSSNVYLLSVSEIHDIISSCGIVKAIDNVTLCLIKPHVLKQKQLGHLIQSITDNGYTIMALQSFHFSMPMLETLFDVYRKIYPSYSAMMDHICSGTSVALMISGSVKYDTHDIVESFREFSGPFHPELAKSLRPKSLRAQFGFDKIKNAVHCTDLPDDGFIECTYVFDTIGS